MSSFDTYPEWPDGLGDPRVSALASNHPRTATDRHEVIAKFRAREAKPLAQKKRPHIRHFQGIQLPQSRCSFHFHCRGAPATKQCHSCANFGENQHGYYCDACFAARHPDFRLPHTWTPVQDVTNQEEEWIAHITRHHLEQDAAELKLLLTETQAFLARSSLPATTATPPPTEKNSAPQTISTSIDFKNTYTTVSRVYGTLQELLGQIHDQLEQKPPLTREEALAKIQSMWKIRKARKQLKALVREVYTSFEDPTTGQTYYYNRYTKETQWTKPAALGSEDLSSCCSNTRKKTKITFESREEEERHAVLKLQAMARCHLARRHMRKLISSIYEKIWDTSTQRFYYHNTKSKEVKWEKPRWVNDEDLQTPRSRYKQLKADEATPSNMVTKMNPKKTRSESLTPETAACMVQRAYRRKIGFRNLLKMCRAVYERIYDPEQGLHYYYNTRTKETTWDKPLLLRGAESDVFTPRTRQKKEREEMLTPDKAARMVQRAFRRKKGFQNLLQMCRAVYERIYDPDQGMYYYHNTRTKETTWEKPLLLRGADSDVFTPRTRQKKLESLMSATISRKPFQWTEEEAATRLQGLYRAKKAKQELGTRLMQRFKQAFDPSSGQAYYVDTLTQEVSWDPPALARRAGVQIETFEE
ncbi:hypothetical protein L917_06430 [Phytophthora nicotianae]|uniref:Probable pectate lyase F n=2 Tax=Phytophthora nicotianae TaxID=4792 RepID=V9FED7_PHYNI|nr:hypothetical protein F443_06748 [Phytophthora nicotianae P1569]ETL95917.1 hypothetical protein L917_06430 [Phytophthora nicotianae]